MADKRVISYTGMYILTSNNGYEFYATDGTKIGDTYEDAYNFFDGYAAVKKNNKWGYINTKGETIIDFIFDKATPVSNGGAWVTYNGKTGRLNIDEIIDNNITLTEDVLNVDSYDTLDDEYTYLEVTVSVINVRNSPSLDGEIITTVQIGDKLAASEMVQSDGYTWYCIGKINEIDNDFAGNKIWVADDHGEWITVLNK